MGILCTGNSCRSQMAKGWFPHLAGDQFEVARAGTDYKEANPLATETMAGLDFYISHCQSKYVREFHHDSFEYLVAVCVHAKETRPHFPTIKTQLHWSFDDFAKATGSSDEQKVVISRSRDKISKCLGKFLRERSQKWSPTSPGYLIASHCSTI